MGPGVGGKRHEDHVLPAGLLDPAAGDDAPRIGEQHDLQQYPGIVGRGPCFVVLEAKVEKGEIEFVVDEMVQGELEQEFNRSSRFVSIKQRIFKKISLLGS
jgi:hypothetical protein